MRISDWGSDVCSSDFPLGDEAQRCPPLGQSDKEFIDLGLSGDRNALLLQIASLAPHAHDRISENIRRDAVCDLNGLLATFCKSPPEIGREIDAFEKASNCDQRPKVLVGKSAPVCAQLPINARKRLGKIRIAVGDLPQSFSSLRAL